MKEYERLRGIRRERNMSVNDVSKMLCVSNKRIYNWETGKHKMPTKYYIKLSKYYNLSLDYIVGLSDDDKKTK
ncbi:MAG: helix-turn-helix transcriptional regulator [Clostridia bacterium]|nr:helix-turn-helix transcriptional regulator [Clostridia bacterium]